MNLKRNTMRKMLVIYQWLKKHKLSKDIILKLDGKTILTKCRYFLGYNFRKITTKLIHWNTILNV